MRERVADDLGELALLADEGEPVAQPRLESDDERTRSFLADGAPLVRPAAANVGLDPIERGDALQRLRCDRRSLGDEAFVEAAPQVRPAEGEAHVALLGERAIAGVAVDLENALEAGKMRDRLGSLAVGRVDIGDRRRVRSAPGPVVSRIGPELAGLGPTATRIEHRRRRLVGEQLRRGLEMRENPLMDGPQMERGPSDPVGERRAVEANALTRVDLRLAIERQVIGVFGNQHVRHRRLGRQAALDEARRGRRLDDDVLAAAAGVFGPTHDQHAELRGNDVELLAHVLADPVQAPPCSTGRSCPRRRRASRCAADAPAGRRGWRAACARLPHAPPATWLRSLPPPPPRPARRLRAQAAIDRPAGSRRGGRSGGAASP